jgi:hypothetical protein
VTLHPSRLTATTLFPRRSSELLDSWRTGKWLVEHAEVGRLRSVTSIPELRDIDQVLALEPGKISAYGVSSTAPQWRRGSKSVRTLQSINHLTADQARSAYDVGLSILCGDLLPLIPELYAQAQGLLSELGLPASGSGAGRLLDISGAEPLEAVMSFSPAGANAALGLHYDAFEVISIQLRGTKVWMLGANEDIDFPLSSFETETPGPQPAQYQQRTRRAPVLERVKMRPGSALFVPRGAWHCTQEVGKDEPSVTLLLKFIPPSFAEVLVTALLADLSERPEWRVPCVGLFRPDTLRKDAMKSFRDLVAGLQLEPDKLLLNHYMPDRAAPELLTFSRTEGATLRVARNGRDATEIVLRIQTPAITGELAVDAALAPLCQWMATARPPFVSFAEARARAGRADEDSVWGLLNSLTEAGVLAVSIEQSAVALPPNRRRARR